MPKKIIWFAALTVLVGFLSFEGIYHLRWVVIAAAPFARTPFTAKVNEVQYDNNGTPNADEVRTMAVASSGAQVDVLDTLDGKPVGNSTVLDLNKRTRISIDPATESITTYPLNAKTVATAKRLLVGTCSDAPGAEHRSLWGQTAFKKIEDQQFGTTSLHTENWLAPALDCFPLESTVVFYRNGVRLGHKTRQVISLITGEPDSSLFVVPGGFTERSPSQVFAELSHRTGSPCPDCEKRSGVLDQAYRSHQR